MSVSMGKFAVSDRLVKIRLDRLLVLVSRSVFKSCFLNFIISFYQGYERTTENIKDSCEDIDECSTGGFETFSRNLLVISHYL